MGAGEEGGSRAGGGDHVNWSPPSVLQRTADVLGVPVWTAVPARRGPHPMAAFWGIWATGMVVGLLLWSSVATLGRGIVTMGLFGVYLALRPTVIIAVTQSEIVVVKTKWWSGNTATPDVLQRYSFDVLRTAGPSKVWFHPVIVGYRRYWVSARHSDLVDQLTGTSFAVSTAQWRR